MNTIKGLIIGLILGFILSLVTLATAADISLEPLFNKVFDSTNNCLNVKGI